MAALDTLRISALIGGALLAMACTPGELASPTVEASPAAPLAVDQLLPTALFGAALVEGPEVDPTTGALGQLVKRLGKTGDDVEIAVRMAPAAGTNSAFVRGVRIAGVDGARLLAAEIALLREIIERDAQAAVPVDVISLGGKAATRLMSPNSDRALYLVLSQDAVFLIGGADEREADDLISQIP